MFGDRVYVYGSHDSFGAPIFCVKDYVCWSAPVTDLSDWRYEGVIYRKNQDPSNKLGIRCLYAPDVTQGPDGRYYLYYAFDFMARWELLSVILRQASTNFTDMFILKMDMYGEKRVGNHFRLIPGYW